MALGRDLTIMMQGRRGFGNHTAFNEIAINLQIVLRWAIWASE